MKKKKNKKRRGRRLYKCMKRVFSDAPIYQKKILIIGDNQFCRDFFLGGGSGIFFLMIFVELMKSVLFKYTASRDLHFVFLCTNKSDIYSKLIKKRRKNDVNFMDALIQEIIF